MRPPVTDEYLLDQIESLKTSATKHRHDMRPGRRRFWIYRYLRDAYQVYLDLQPRRRFKKAIRKVAKELQLPCNRKAHPIRILIEASCGPEDARQKGRWTQALIYALGWKTEPARLIWFFEQCGGISGAASKLAALHRANRSMVTNVDRGDGVITPKMNTASISDARS